MRARQEAGPPLPPRIALRAHSQPLAVPAAQSALARAPTPPRIVAPRGRCIQVKVHGRLSDMQEAEADMAKDKGVPVVVLDCRQVKGCTTEAQLEAMPEWAKLISMIDTPQGERTIPRTREELETVIETNELVAKEQVDELQHEVDELQHELQRLRAQLARLEGVPTQRD